MRLAKFGTGALLGLMGFSLMISTARALPAPTQAVSAPPQSSTSVAPAASTDPNEIFTVRDVKMDVTAENAAAARDKAIADGQRAALATLLKTLQAEGKGIDPAAYSDAKIAALVRSFEIVSEKTSAVRYIATMNVRFKPRAIQAKLASAGIDYAVPMPRTVLLPISLSRGRPVLWEETTPWRSALEELSNGDSGNIMVPTGELNDISAIDANSALAGNSAAIGGIAGLNQAERVVVAHMEVETNALDPSLPLPITLTRYDAQGQSQERQRLTVPAAADSSAQLQAARRMIKDYLRGKKPTPPAADNLAPTQNAAELITLYAPLGSLPELTRLKQRLESVPRIRRIDVASIRRDGALIGLDYDGTLPELQTNLQTRGMSLQQMPDGQWQILSGN
jgi:hypothetical protein